jgi:hypothetical protein
MGTNQTTSLVIKEHDFQEVKNALKRYTEQAKEEVELSRVPTDGGLFNLGDHKVTGSELNRITTQIQDYLICLNHLNQGLVDEFGQVYKAFEYLDKDYISGIVASIKATEKVSMEEQKDRKDIKELIEQHKQAIAVLKKFKADIEKLKHLTDIDKAWELIEKQTKLSKELSDYIAGLSELKHLKDIDELWDNTESIVRSIECIKESIETQSKTISIFDETVQSLQTEQRNFIEEINKVLYEFRENFDNQVKMLVNSQTEKLSNIEKSHAQAVEQLVGEQREKLSAIEKDQNEKYDSVIKEQTLTLSRIEKTQKETFEQLSEEQSAMLEQIFNEQSANWGKTIKLFEEEKTALNEQVANIMQKVKFSYLVAGGAVTLTIIQLFLNILGVL